MRNPVYEGLTLLRLAFVVMVLSIGACSQGSAPTPKTNNLPVVDVLVYDIKTTLLSSSDNYIVPDDLVITRGGMTGVFVLDENSEARYRMVRLGRGLNNSSTEILSGLNGDEKLIASQLGVISDGSPVNVIQ